MKRKGAIITGVFAAVLAVTAACGSSSSGGSGSSGSSYKLAFVPGVIGDPFYVTMQCSIQAEAKKLGVSVSVNGPQKFDPTLQTPVLQSVVASKPDALLIAPTDVSAMQQPIEQAARNNIKVVLVDTTLKDPSVAVSAISSDNLGGGKAAFDAIKQLAPNGGKVLVVSVQPGVSTTDDRAKGFEDAVKADPKYTYLGVQYDNDDASKAAQIVTSELQAHPDIVGIFATNLFSGEGSATGVRQAGKQGQVKIVGFDAGPDQVKDLQADTVQALVAQQPGIIGKDAVDQAVASLKGQPVTKKIGTEFSVITKANLNSPTGKAALYKSSC
ncbi:MAG TPA: ABC transporter substrate-binding protein [Pseudonocardiaceae bacterium]|jgi:ribose transport system substrate-binding protein|nr:ABC transporter substrate-binding protein [Pseudonocardiaceae bacterium]